MRTLNQIRRGAPSSGWQASYVVPEDLARWDLVMRWSTHIKTPGVAGEFSASAHPRCGMTRGRIPRELRSRSLIRRLSGEGAARSFSRDSDGVGERELRRGWAAPHPSGQSVSAVVPRERDGVGEREVRRGLVCAGPPGGREAALRVEALRSLPAIGIQINRGTTSRGRATPTSRPVSMISPSSDLNPVSDARPRW